MAPVRIAIVPNESTAEIVCGRLRTEGIECSYRRTDLAVGASDGALSGAGPIEVLVEESDVDAARAVLPAE
jgi:hypothetical protein